MSEGLGERSRRPPWEEFRRALEARGYRPSRRLGQNFLLDENQAFAIARDAGFEPGDFVLEVGAGCGFLSVHLVELGARLLAVEIDPRLAEVSGEFLGVKALAGGEPAREEGETGEGDTGLAVRPERAAPVLVLSDILAGKHALAPVVERHLPTSGRWHLVSNLPYSVSAPVLSLCADREPAPESMTVLVQREVAERVAAEPGTRAWGPLSVVLQCGYTASILRRIGPASFWPRPKVDSAVLRLELRPDRPDPANRARLRRLVALLFQRRRQSLGRVLADRAGGRENAQALLGELGWDAGMRAESLPVADLQRLADAWERVAGPLT